MRSLTRIGILMGLVAVPFLINPDVTRAQKYNYRGCAWPIELSPEGAANVQGPDSFARYWAMPFDTQYDSMTITGTYPNARYFSLAAYNTLNNDFDLAGHLYDAQIAPDQGSINPFLPPGGRNGTYTVVISRTNPSSGNTIAVAPEPCCLGSPAAVRSGRRSISERSKSDGRGTAAQPNTDGAKRRQPAARGLLAGQ